MTNENSHIVTLRPLSSQPLVHFDAFTRVRHKVLQSTVIAMPPQHLPTDPSAPLFQPPIQIVVLGIDSEEVELGVYANEFLQLQQGPSPDRQWRERWQQARLGSSQPT